MDKIDSKNKKDFRAIGILDVNAFSNAVIVIDEVLKAADVEIVSCEKKLGGRLVTTVIAGSVSAVNSAIEVAKGLTDKIGDKNLKLAIVISNPHDEILKVLNLQ